jgi:CRP-like cAMP-binding protein
MDATHLRYAYCLDALRKTPFFTSLNDAVQHEILGMFQYQNKFKRDYQMAEDEITQNFHLVVSGRAKASVYHPETGREHILYLLGPGDGFDVITLLDAQPDDVIATALDDMEILTAPLGQVRTWLFDHPDFNRAFFPYLANLMREHSQQIENLALYDTETRLARLILQHLTSNAPVHNIRLINDLSQETLAAMIGSVRVVVSRQMQKWSKEGVVDNEHKHWSIDDLSALIKKAQQQFGL